MLRRLFVVAALAGCGRFVDEDGDLWPPPETGSTVERREPDSFDPCPHLEVDAPLLLSSSDGGTSAPRIAWNQDRGQFMVVWRDGGRIAFRRLDGGGNPLGLERTARETDGTPVQADGDPAVLSVPGQQEAPFFVTVQRGDELGIDRILGDDEAVQPQSVPLAGAIPGETRIPALASDGQRIAIAYRSRSDGTQLVSLDLRDDGPRCAHESDDDPPQCLDSDTAIEGPASIGWLPRGALPDDVAPNDTAAVVAPSWWMAVHLPTSRNLLWLVLQPPQGSLGPLEHRFPNPQLGADDIDSAPRIATGNRRFAIAIRRGEGTEAWQMSDDGTLACVLSAPALAEGEPAIAWAHGRRLAVVGLLPGGRGRRDVVLVRGDAPVTEADRELAVRRACPAPIEETELTLHDQDVVARDPDVAFSGDGLGIAWAQATVTDPAADVWFALARCVP